MQYLVKVSGDVLDKKDRTYVINSHSVEGAQQIASQSFCEEFAIKGDAIVVKSSRRTLRAITAMIFLLVPVFLSCGVSWGTGHELISIRPDELSCLYSVLIYAAFVVRYKGIRSTFASWIDISFFVFMILLLSSFVQTVLVEEEFSFFGLFDYTVNTKLILLVAVILSWLGLKIVSLVCMGGIMLFAMTNIANLSDALGTTCGPIYIICSFIGIMMYLSVEPAVVEILSQARYSAGRGLRYISHDVSTVKTKVLNGKSAVEKKDDFFENK